MTVTRTAGAGALLAGGHTVSSSSGIAASGRPYLSVTTADPNGAFPWRVRQSGDRGWIDFLLRSAGEIEIGTRGEVSERDLEAYFTGPVLGHLLRARGVTCLHGGFVAPDGMAVGVIGPKGAGKSSLVAAWARAGVPVAADDIGALARGDDGSCMVAPGYPRLRLWPDSAIGLDLPGTHIGKQVLSFADKAYLDLRRRPFRFDSHRRPLGAILVLGPRGADPALEPLPQGQALVALLANVYAPRAGGPVARARDIEALTAVCRSVPVFGTSLPDRFAWLRDESAALLRRLSEEARMTA